MQLRRADLANVAPVLFLFLLPITHTTPARIAALVLSLVSAVAARERRATAHRPPTPLLAAIVFWILVCTAACFTSIEPAYSWGELRNEVLSTTVAFCAFYALTDSAAALLVWSRALLASFVVVAPIATVSYLLGGEWSRAGLVGDRNAYSTYVVLIVPLLLLEWLEADGRAIGWRIAFSAAILLALVSGAFTQNRNMWFGIALEVVVFATLVWLRQTRETRRRLRGRMLAAGLLGTVLFVATMAYVVHQKAIISNTSTEEQARFDRDPRFEIWVYAAQRIEERPWFGHGYGRGILRSDFRTHFDNPLKWHGHNVLVDALLEAGVVGGLAIVALWGAFALRAGQLWRGGDPALWPLGAWVIAMIVGIGIKITTDDILVRETSLMFWSILGMVFGLASRHGVREAVVVQRTPGAVATLAR